jgi:hypothetical protein
MTNRLHYDRDSDHGPCRHAIFSSIVWLINERYQRSLFAMIGTLWIADAWGLMRACKR